MSKSLYDIGYAETVTELEKMKNYEVFKLRDQFKICLNSQLLYYKHAESLKGMINMTFIEADLYVGNKLPGLFPLRIALSTDSFPITHPIIQFVLPDGKSFNTKGNYISSEGFVNAVLFKDWNSAKTMVDLGSILRSVVQGIDIYIDNIEKPNIVNPNPNPKVDEEDSTPKLPFPIPSMANPKIREIIDKYWSGIRYIPFEKLEMIKEVGEGATSTCYLCNWNGTKVCVKVMKYIPTGDSEIKFYQEVGINNSIKHKNVIQVYGLSITGDEKPCIVSQYANYGTLYNYLSCLQKPVDPMFLKSFFLQIVEALEELHSRNIIHRDIKFENILVADHIPLIADFGFSRELKNKIDAMSRVGTPAFAAPELFSRQAVYNEKVDIYALGLVGYYIFTDVFLVKDIMTRNDFATLIVRGYKYPIDPKLNPVLRDIFTSCLQVNFQKRPSCTEIIQKLNEFNGNIYEEITL
ncbi:hypothetical protein WA158_002191 [Blastocystis sp. Blastoise]